MGEIQGLQCLCTASYVPEDLGLPLTVICLIVTPTRTLSVRALIDPGSQITAIEKSLAAELGLKGPRRNLRIGTSGAQKIIFKNMIVVNFKIASLEKDFAINVEAITMPKVACDIGKININPQDYNHLKEIKFSETLPMCQIN